ncbi:MAG: DUF5050 domain-containing protein [Lachnospiraceae bacterium]|nr:DUF5050 domain-containing protein [Lachnospiraceae bacterium]
MNEKVKLFLILGGIALAFAILFVIDSFAGRIPENPAGTVGNTAGNLYNGGYFCEDSEGRVFFSNSYDHGSLYVMNADESNVEKLSANTVKSINTGGDYIYYYMSDSSASSGLGFVRRVIGVYRSDKEGKDITTLSRFPAGTLLLVDNSLYVQSIPDEGGVNLLKLSLDGKEETVLSTDKIYPASVYNGRIYYNDNANSHFLYQWDTYTDANAMVVKYNMWNPTRQGDYIYFMDILENYRLCRYSLSEDIIEVLNSDRVDSFNVTDNYVFYQKSSDTQPGLMRISLDGSEEIMLAEGVYNNINATSHYVYFQEFGDTITTYRVPLSGTEVSEFYAAANAVTTSE